MSLFTSTEYATDPVIRLPLVRFFAVGQPQPAGSKRAFRNPRSGRILVTDDNKRSKPWQAIVASAGAEQMGAEFLISIPSLEVDLDFIVPRPKGHYGTGRNAALLKPSAPAFPAVKPDVLKLARSVEDALTGVVWRDDAQIVTERLTKRYGSPAGVRVTVWEAA